MSGVSKKEHNQVGTYLAFISYFILSPFVHLGFGEPADLALPNLYKVLLVPTPSLPRESATGYGALTRTPAWHFISYNNTFSQDFCKPSSRSKTFA